jgi:uncharacterized membrane protein YhiD involved in acid resistance
MGVGVGEYLFSITSSALILTLLFAVPILERIIDNHHQIRTIIVTTCGTKKLNDVLLKMERLGLNPRKFVEKSLAPFPCPFAQRPPNFSP